MADPLTEIVSQEGAVLSDYRQQSPRTYSPTSKLTKEAMKTIPLMVVLKSDHLGVAQNWYAYGKWVILGGDYIIMRVGNLYHMMRAAEPLWEDKTLGVTLKRTARGIISTMIIDNVDTLQNILATIWATAMRPEVFKDVSLPYSDPRLLREVAATRRAEMSVAGAKMDMSMILDKYARSERELQNERAIAAEATTAANVMREENANLQIEIQKARGLVTELQKETAVAAEAARLATAEAAMIKEENANLQIEIQKARKLEIDLQKERVTATEATALADSMKKELSKLHEDAESTRGNIQLLKAKQLKAIAASDARFVLMSKTAQEEINKFKAVIDKLNAQIKELQPLDILPGMSEEDMAQLKNMTWKDLVEGMIESDGKISALEAENGRIKGEHAAIIADKDRQIQQMHRFRDQDEQRVVSLQRAQKPAIVDVNIGKLKDTQALLEKTQEELREAEAGVCRKVKNDLTIQHESELRELRAAHIAKLTDSEDKYLADSARLAAENDAAIKKIREEDERHYQTDTEALKAELVSKTTALEESYRDALKEIDEKHQKELEELSSDRDVWKGSFVTLADLIIKYTK